MSSTANPGAYPGNPSLPKEVREKILSTFRHTLNLYKESKTDDCVIGCDFILKMDPRFAPARQLMEKARNPAAAIDVGELEAIVALTPTRQERMASVDVDKVLVRAAESLNARDFDAAMAAAEQVLQALPGNRDAAAILEKARRRKEAGPQLEATRQRAMMALEGQRPAEARAALEKMRSIDPDHPSVALLERRLSSEAGPAEIGESTNPGLSLGSSEAEPGREAPSLDATPLETPGDGGLGDLSLDSLSLDEPLDSPAAVPTPDYGSGNPRTGPLSLDEFRSADASPAFGSEGPGGLWSDVPAEPEAASSPDGYPAAFSMGAPDAAESAPAPPSPQEEIEGLLARGDDAARGGNRQQAIEIWSRIFLIDINNSDAVGRIEAARKEMAEGNRRAADGLRLGREKFEAGDFTAAREAFLQVLAVDETDATARTYLDRIEQELARPSSGLDLSRKTPPGDILAEEMAEAAEPEIADEPEPEPEVRTAPPTARRPPDKRFVIAIGGALLLAVAIGAWFMLRKPAGPGAPAASAGGPSLQHATELFRDGKVAETIAELRLIPASHPDYARAQKLLASLSRKSDGEEPAPGAAPAEGGTGSPAAAGPSPEAIAQREVAEKALEEKRYIDALKNFNLAAAAFSTDPSFSQSMGVASDKVGELMPAVKLYNEGEYETAIPILWRIYQADRTNHDARAYLMRCYYNQGIGQLQNGLYPKAVESFSEVVAIDPSDADAARHKKFAERYLKGDLDLMGRIYVRHVQQRP